MPATPAENEIAPSPAQWALGRMLDAAFDDRETATKCMDLALSRAGRRSVPESIDEVLTFGREHLLPIMAEELGPRLVQALFDDLSAELLRRSDVHTTLGHPLQSSLPRLTVPPVITDAPKSNPTIQSPAPDHDLNAVRPVIAIVEADRWVRASVARVLVQGGCDVLPLDGPNALAELPHEIDILVIDLGNAELAAVRAFTARRPLVRVVAWTHLEANEAGRRLKEAGVVRSAAVARTATAAQLAETIRSVASRAS